MLSASSLFKREIRENTSLYISCKIQYNDGTEETIEGDRVMSGSISFDDSISASGVFEIGASIINTFNLTLNNYDGHFDEKDFTDAVIYPTLKKDLSDGTTELIPRGIYIVEQPSAYGSTIALTCNDFMVKFEKDFSNVSVTYPITLGELAEQICTYCGVTLYSAVFDKYDYSLTSGPSDTSTMNCLDVIGAIAQISGNYATIDIEGKLRFRWHDTLVNDNDADGGTFTTSTTPYKDGDDLDGGDFTYNVGDVFDGGDFDFTDRPYQIYSFSSFEINTDPVVVTGLKAITDDNEYLYGAEGYILEISNDFITDDNAQAIVDNIGSKIVGLKFRPYNISTLTDPTLQCGDVIYLVKNTVYYRTTITHLNLKVGGYSTYECTAETPSRNNGKTYSKLTKTTTTIKKETKKQLSAYDVAVQTMNNLIAQSFGVFRTEEVQEDGSIIYYMHDKPNLEDSSNIWRFAGEVFTVSDDGGETWVAGIDSSGNAVLNVLSAIGINFSWAHGGTLKLGGIDNVNGQIEIYDSLNRRVGAWNNEGLGFAIEGENEEYPEGSGTIVPTAYDFSILPDSSTAMIIHKKWETESGIVSLQLLKIGTNGKIYVNDTSTKYATTIGDGNISIFGTDDDGNAIRVTELVATRRGDSGGYGMAGYILGYSGKALQFGTYSDSSETTLGGFYYMNKTLNPSGFTERHIFSGTTRFFSNIYLGQNTNAYIYSATYESDNFIGVKNLFLPSDGACNVFCETSAYAKYVNYASGGIFSTNGVSIYNSSGNGWIKLCGFTDGGVGFNPLCNIHATAFVEGSDRRIKDNIEELPDEYVELIDELEPKKYTLKLDNSNKMGFVAQDVMEACENLGLDDSAIVSGSEEEYYSLNYNALIPILWKGLQDARQRIAELEEKLNER